MFHPEVFSSFNTYPRVSHEENQRLMQEEQELHERERKYLHEFELQSCKFATKMSDLTDNEVRLWKHWLNYHFRWDVTSNIVDLFDYENSDIYNDEIRIMEWQWTHNGKVDILLDINAWPGDNEGGAIFLNNEMVLINSDQAIYNTPITPQELNPRIDALAHIRIQRCTEEADYYDNPPDHEHCKNIKIKYDECYRNKPKRIIQGPTIEEIQRIFENVRSSYQNY